MKKAGEVIDHIIAAVEQHGATPHTDVHVRIGEDGPMYRLANLKGCQDQRGFTLILETEQHPEIHGVQKLDS